MQLTNKQKQTLEHLKNIQRITKPLDIIKHCIDKLQKPRHGAYIKDPLTNIIRRVKHSESRKYSKEHYQGIINYLAQKKNVPAPK